MPFVSFSVKDKRVLAPKLNLAALPKSKKFLDRNSKIGLRLALGHGMVWFSKDHMQIFMTIGSRVSEFLSFKLVSTRTPTTTRTTRTRRKEAPFEVSYRDLKTWVEFQ